MSEVKITGLDSVPKEPLRKITDQERKLFDWIDRYKEYTSIGHVSKHIHGLLNKLLLKKEYPDLYEMVHTDGKETLFGEIHRHFDRPLLWSANLSFLPLLILRCNFESPMKVKILIEGLNIHRSEFKKLNSYLGFEAESASDHIIFSFDNYKEADEIFMKAVEYKASIEPQNMK